MENEDVKSEKGELDNLLRQNRELLEKVYESSEKTRRYMLWTSIAQIVKVLFIVIMLVTVLVFLRPALQNVVDIYTGSYLDEL